MQSLVEVKALCRIDGDEWQIETRPRTLRTSVDAVLRVSQYSGRKPLPNSEFGADCVEGQGRCTQPTAASCCAQVQSP